MTAHELAPIGAFAVSHNDNGYWMITTRAPGIPEFRRWTESDFLAPVAPGLARRRRRFSGWNFLCQWTGQQPKPGTYQVFSKKSRHTIAGHDDIRMEYMVRFTWG